MAIRHFAALTAAAVAALVAVPAAARPADVRTTDVRAADLRDPSICARDLASAQCGRYQHQLLQATALRAGDRADQRTLRDIGRRQLDQLIDTIS